MPLPGVPEPARRSGYPPVDCSPSRARLGRVAAMIQDAERAAPESARRAPHGPGAGVVVSLLPRRATIPLPRPRTDGADVERIPRPDAPGDLTAALRRI